MNNSLLISTALTHWQCSALLRTSIDSCHWTIYDLGDSPFVQSAPIASTEQYWTHEQRHAVHHSSITWFQANRGIKIWVLWPIFARAGRAQRITCRKKCTFFSHTNATCCIETTRNLKTVCQIRIRVGGTSCFLVPPKNVRYWKIRACSHRCI